MKKFILGFIVGILLVPLAHDIVEYFDNNASHVARDKYCALAGKTKDTCSFEIWYYHFKEDNPKLEELSLKFIDIHTPLSDVITHRCDHRIFINPNVPEDSGKMTNREYFECWPIQNWLNNIIFWEWK